MLCDILDPIELHQKSNSFVRFTFVHKELRYYPFYDIHSNRHVAGEKRISKKYLEETKLHYLNIKKGFIIAQCVKYS